MSLNVNTGLTSITGSVQASVSGAAIPSSTQVTHTAFVYYTTTATYYQIATPDATHDIYFVGFRATNTNAASPYIVIFDAAAGNMPAPSANTLYQDEAGDLYLQEIPTVNVTSFQLAIPYKCRAGLRLHAGNAGAAGKLWVDYIVVEK